MISVKLHIKLLKQIIVDKMGVNFFISKKCVKPSTIHNVGNIKESTQCKKNTQDNVEVYILVK